MESLKSNLNEKQVEAAFYGNGPLLIAAGAGSGKTKTLTTRVIHLLHQGIPAEHVIAITFTNKAAKEMEERVAKSLAQIANHSEFPISDSRLALRNMPFIGTFHALGARILRKECARLGRGPNYTIYDSDDSARVIRQAIKRLNIKKTGFGPALFKNTISNIKDEVYPEEKINSLLEGDEKDRMTALIYGEYEKVLKENNAFDFDDLIEKPVRLFANNPDILKKYQEKFSHILVDEYQDINNAQYLFIKFLASAHRNLSVVGDDSQAIYAFRGANFRNFLNFEKDWPNAKIVLLEENYRSASNIIEAASALIGNNKLQKQKNLWTRNPAGSVVKILEHRNPEDEAQRVVGTIAESFEPTNTTPTGSGISSPSLLKITAILYRTNAQSRPIEQALIERNIQYQIFGGIRFYDRKEIKDIVAGLRYAVNPQDAVSLERLDKNFLKKQYLTLKEKLPEAGVTLGPGELVQFIVKTTNYFEYLVKNFPNATERIQNVHELLRFASSFTQVADFLERVSLAASADLVGEKANTPAWVHLMTVHSAKGLEFDKVFIIGANEGLLPHQMSYQTSDEIEEERRLMYVAMTRAKKELTLSFYDIPSRFLYEIPGHLVEFSGEKSLDDEERWISLD